MNTNEGPMERSPDDADHLHRLVEKLVPTSCLPRASVQATVLTLEMHTKRPVPKLPNELEVQENPGLPVGSNR